MKAKKDIIISAAIDLFNEQGLANTKKQDIAKRAGISLSNLNYNFKDKRDLVYAVFDHMRTVLEEKVYGHRKLIVNAKAFEITKSYFEFEQEFRFFYVNTNNILFAYPELHEKILLQIKEAIEIIKHLNFMAIGMGYLQPLPKDYPDLYDKLAKQIWVSNHFHFAQRHILDEKGDPIVEGLEASFLLISPYLTEKGLKAYRDFINDST